MIEEKINPDFNIPYYIFEEIVEYIEETNRGKCKCMKWANIRGLLACAVANNNLTLEQAKHLEKTYCREGKEEEEYLKSLETGE